MGLGWVALKRLHAFAGLGAEFGIGCTSLQPKLFGQAAMMTRLVRFLGGGDESIAGDLYVTIGGRNRKLGTLLGAAFRCRKLGSRA